MSTTFTASVVLLEKALETRRALPVAEALIYVTPFNRPVLETAVDDDAPTGPVTGASTLRLTGSGLKADSVSVRIGEVEHDATSGATANEILLDLSTVSGLEAGFAGFRVSGVGYAGIGDLQLAGAAAGQ